MILPHITDNKNINEYVGEKRMKYIKISFWKIMLSIFLIAITMLIIIFFTTLHWVNNTEVKMIGKTHSDLYVAPEQPVDYNIFLNPDEDTKILNEIPLSLRKAISDYMKKNNLKLKEGHHYFKRSNGTYEEYINDNFKFEKIE